MARNKRHLTTRVAHLRTQRTYRRRVNKLQAAKAQTIKAQAIAKQQGKPEEHRKRLQQRIIRFKDKRSYWRTVLKDERLIEDVDDAEISYWHSMREEAMRYMLEG